MFRALPRWISGDRPRRRISYGVRPATVPYAEGTILIYNVKGAAGGRMDGATVTPSNLSTSSSMRAA